VEVSDGYSHDYHHFKPLVDHTAKQGFNLKEISADKGYLGADNMMTALRHGAVPYIPFKTNSVAQSGWEPKSQLWTRMYHFYALNRAEFLQHDHKRSNRRNDVSHDQIKVWSTLAESDAHGADQRGSVQGAMS
jgi:hypothetical protein